MVLEGPLAGKQDSERLEAPLEHFNIFGATGWHWGWPRGRGVRGAEEYRILKGSSERVSFTIRSRECGVRGDPARYSGHLHLHGWPLVATGGFFGNRDNLRAGERRSKR